MGARTLPRILAAALLAVPLAAPATAPAAKRKPRLEAFASCSSLIRYGNRHVPRYAPVTPVPARPILVGGGTEGATGAPVVAAPAPASGDAGASPDVSTTNNQEPGVDEADTVKTDGRTIWSVTSDGVLRAVDVTGATPRLVSALKLGGGYDHELLRHGDRILAMWHSYGGPVTVGAGTATVAPMPMRSVTRLALVSVADPAKPVLLRTLDVDGDLVAARMTGSTARIVLAALPRSFTVNSGTTREHANAWLPAGTFTNVRAKRSKRHALIPCRAVRHPRAFSGLETLTVLTIDPDKGLEPIDSDGLMSGGETVYASEDNLYVATQRDVPGLEERTSGDVPDGMSTEIHRFSTRADGATVYRGSGRVPGFLLSQYAMSERGGVLRVASTDEPPWFSEDRRTSSAVTTLRLTDGGLTRLGQVGGLGKGERIYAVRFIDDTGYVVTFRQIDPLYTVDLSDPAAPRVAGELELLGYSAYLHPAGRGRLIGVGQDATPEGRRQGTAVSLFDVSDPAAPKLLQRATVGAGSSSAVEYDPHAFLWWPRTRLAVVPVQLYDVPPMPADGVAMPTVAPQQSFNGAIGFTIGDDAISELGRITHAAGDGYAPGITRSVVVGDTLYTLSDTGLKASRLATLADVAFVPFG